MSIFPRPLWLAAALALAFAAPAGAEPYFAQREGYSCGKCHVNRTGGGKRTAFGYQYAATHLNALASAPPDPADPAARPALPGGIWRSVDPQLSDALSVGANLRLSSSTIFAKKVHNSFESQEANLYLQVDATQNVTAYVDLSVAQGTVESREAFLLLSALGASLKAGYLLPPFGLRIWGDDEFIRRETGYGFANPDLGLELGYEAAGYGAFLAATNGSGGGSDPDNAKKLSLRLERWGSVLRLGLSGSFNQSSNRTVSIGGPFAGFTWGRLTLLTEADLITTRYLQVRENVYSLVAYLEGDLLIRRGLNLKVSYGYHDPDLQQVEDQRMAVRGAIDFAPTPFVLVGLRYTLAQSIPQDEVGNADVLMAELHLYF